MCQSKRNQAKGLSLADHAGLYLNKGYGKIVIRLTGDSLIATKLSRPVYYRPKNYDVFETLVKNRNGFDTSDIGLVRFDIDNSGAISQLVWEAEAGVKPIVFDRTPEEKPIPKDSLKKYVGDYTVTPAVTAKMYIKMDSVLYLFVPGQPEYELSASGKDAFVIKNVNGYSLQFRTDESETVTEVLFVQPNGTCKAVRKKD